MSVVSAPHPPVQDAAGCRAWLDALDGDERARLSAIDRLLSALAPGRLPAEQALAVLETARPVQLAAVDALLARLLAQGVPLSADGWVLLGSMRASLAASGELYRHLYTRLVEDSGLSAHAVIPGAVESIEPVLPLARALDAEARLLAVSLRLRVDAPQARWRSACALADQLRRSSFVDDALPDPAPPMRGASARALFVYPLLLRLAHLDALDDGEVLLVDRLARRWAAKVGFRIDRGHPPPENRHGPTICVEPRLWVRLDTHRLQRSLVARLDSLVAGKASAQEGGGPKLPRGMSIEQARRLLGMLKLCWSEAWRAAPAPGDAVRPVRVRFGMPAPRTVEGADGAQTRAGGVANAAYVFGRHESNTILRIALGAQRSEDDSMSALMRDARSARWSGPREGPVTVELGGGGPRIELGTLVVLATLDEQPAARLLLGRVVAVRQSRAADDPPVVQLQVALWEQPVSSVGVRVGDAPFYEDAFRLDGEPQSVVVASGRWRMDAPASLRLAHEDLRIRFGRPIERGPGYERVQIDVLGP